MKTGAPTAEVTIPIGSSAGRIAMRATMSAAVRTMAPSSEPPI